MSYQNKLIDTFSKNTVILFNLFLFKFIKLVVFNMPTHKTKNHFC